MTERTRSAPTVLALVCVLVATVLSGCGGSSAAAGGGAKELRYQGWTNQVTLPELAADLGYLKDVKLSWVGNTISGPQDIQAVVGDQIDVGGAFDGAVANLVAKGAPIQAVVSYYGSDDQAYNGFYVLRGSPVRSGRDLIGKKIGVNTLGGHNEAVIDSYLAQQGLSADEIDQVQLVPLPPPNADQSLRAGQIDVAALSGQFRDQTLARGGVRALFTDSQLFGDFSAGTYVFRADFIRRNPQTVRTFVEAVGKAIEWTRATPQPEVIRRYEKIIRARKRNESTASLRYWHSTGVATKGGVIEDGDFARWEPWLRSSGSISGRLDVRAIYTNAFNPFAGGAS